MIVNSKNFQEKAILKILIKIKEIMSIKEIKFHNKIKIFIIEKMNVMPTNTTNITKGKTINQSLIYTHHTTIIHLKT